MTLVHPFQFPESTSTIYKISNYPSPLRGEGRVKGEVPLRLPAARSLYGTQGIIDFELFPARGQDSETKLKPASAFSFYCHRRTQRELLMFACPIRRGPDLWDRREPAT